MFVMKRSQLLLVSSKQAGQLLAELIFGLVHRGQGIRFSKPCFNCLLFNAELTLIQRVYFPVNINGDIAATIPTRQHIAKFGQYVLKAFAVVRGGPAFLSYPFDVDGLAPNTRCLLPFGASIVQGIAASFVPESVWQLPAMFQVE